MARKQHSLSPRAQGARILGLSLLAGMGLSLVLLFLSAVLMTKLGIPAAHAGVPASIALCAGSFAAGFVSGRAHGQGGLGSGLLCGVALFAILFLAGLPFSETGEGVPVWARLLFVLGCAGAGGVFGVNFSVRKY